MNYTYYLFYAILACFGLALLAQARVRSTYRKYSEVHAQSGMTARQAAEEIMTHARIHGVQIERIEGELKDHYDPHTRTLRLSSNGDNATSIAAIAVAAHEAGHAIQHGEEYGPMRVRSALVPVVNFCSTIAFPLLLLGMFTELFGLVDIALVLYATSLVFHLVTLPVEFDASNRAKSLLLACGVLTMEEERQAGKVLNAAAMTYVITAIISALQVLRLFLNTRRR